MTLLRYDITFSGRVQGVYFRGTTVEVARGFKVDGWVRNEPDGSVRCVVEGDGAELDRFVSAVHEAKRANISDVSIRRIGNLPTGVVEPVQLLPG